MKTKKQIEAIKAELTAGNNLNRPKKNGTCWTAWMMNVPEIN